MVKPSLKLPAKPKDAAGGPLAVRVPHPRPPLTLPSHCRPRVSFAAQRPVPSPEDFLKEVQRGAISLPLPLPVSLPSFETLCPPARPVW